MNERADIRTRLVLAIYSVCFAIGAFNHARDFLAYGWRPYAWAPVPLEMFWSSLIIFDCLAVMLLGLRIRKHGLILAAVIMTLDVTANTYALVVLNIPAFGVAVVLQATFLGFVIGSIPFVWPSSVVAPIRPE